MDVPGPDFEALLEVLTRHEVRFLVVGGVSAVLNGVAMTTMDLDVVPELSEENAGRLHAALEELDAWFRTHPQTKLRPLRSDLVRRGHALPQTRFGALDVLGSVVGDRDYEALIDDASEMDLGLGRPVRVLSLQRLVRLKAELGREKDRAVLGLLRAAIAEQEGPGGEG